MRRMKEFKSEKVEEFANDVLRGMLHWAWLRGLRKAAPLKG